MQENTKNFTKKVVRVAIIAALYVALTFVTFPVASGAIQFRVSEGLCMLPLIFPETAISLGIGCALANLLTGCAVFDIIFGSIISLIAGVLTALVGKFIKNMPWKLILGGIFPVVLNAFLLPLIWLYCYGALEYVYMLQVVFLLISQSVAIYGLGIPLYFAVKKLRKD